MPELATDNHTAGEWKVAIGNVHGRCVTGIMSGATWVVGNVVRPIENPADAYLMAAAPNLLASCRELLDQVDPNSDAAWRARKAIEKATEEF